MPAETLSFVYDDGSILKRPLVSCDTPWRRAWGMLGVRSKTETVYRIVPCNGIHTFFMAFAIDAIFIDRDGNVLKARRVSPYRLFSCPGAWAVVEGLDIIKGNKALERILE